jgi:hypothetical protein
MKNHTMFINFIRFQQTINYMGIHGDSTMKDITINKVRRRLYCFTRYTRLLCSMCRVSPPLISISRLTNVTTVSFHIR